MSAFDPRLHAAIKAISHIGGQHGQESEEGEEGEERSEEDCEEDPQGRQEEEVSSLFGIAGSFMPATSREPPGDLPVLVNPTGGSSRRERVSARHQVNRLERRFRKSLLPNGDPAEERFFDGHVLRSVWTTGPRIHGRSSLR